SGVAPALPVLFMLAVIYSGIWVYLRMLVDWTPRYIGMKSLCLDGILPSDFSSKFAAIDKNLVGSFESNYWLGLFLAVFIAGFLALRPWVILDMIEVIETRILAWITFGACLFILTINFFRFVTVWKRFKAVLVQLERLPIRTAFSRLPHTTSMPILAWSSSES